MAFAAGLLLSQLLSFATPAQQFDIVRNGGAASEGLSFELGGNQNVTVQRPAGHGSNTVTVGQGEALAFVEGPITGIRGRILASNGQRGLLILANAEIVRLQARQDYWVRSIHSNDLPPSQGLKAAAPHKALPFAETEPVTVNRTRLTERLRVLAGEIPTQIGDRSVTFTDRASAENRKNTQDWLAEQLQTLGLDVQRQCYTSGRYQGCNIEATQWGVDRSRSIMLTAHFDSVTQGGADDDGSGTATLLEIADALSSRALPKTVRYVFFDQEERGLIGSAAYAETLRSDQEAYPSAVFNIDMIGFDGDNDGKIHIMDCDRTDSRPLRDAVMAAITRSGVPLTRSEACTNRSDHASFWNKRIPAIIVSENFFGNDGNSCYHRSCDTVARMNLDYYFRISDAMATLAWAVAN